MSSLSKLCNIGKLIYPKLNSVCSTYPLVAENSVKFPFIIYRTSASRPVNSKDGIYDWIYTVEIRVVSDKYDVASDLSIQVVDKLLELEDVMDMEVEDVTEDYVEDAYVRNINIVISK
jgi:hypothetical protein